MFKRLVLFLLVCALGGGAYYYLKFWYKPGAGKLWDFVPSKAIVVYESNDVLKSIESAKSKGAWKSIENVDIVQSIDSSFQYLQGLVGKQNLGELVTNNQYLLAVSPVSSSKFGFTHFISFDEIEHHTLAKSVLDNLTGQQGFYLKTRNYLGSSITELTKGRRGLGAVDFSFVLYDNYFIGSHNALLVEDALRTINEGGANSFEGVTESMDKKVVKLQGDHGNLYFQSQKIQEVLSMVLGDDFPLSKKPFGSISNTYLDLRFHDEHISLTGFGFEAKGVLSLFTGDNGSENTLIDLLPESTAVFYHTSFNNSKNHLQNLTALIETEFLVANQRRQQLITEYDFDVTTVLQYLHQEYGLIRLPGTESSLFDDVVVFKTENRDEVLTYLKILVDRIAKKKSKFVLEEDYRDYRINGLDFQGFSSALFGDFYQGGETAFYTSIGEYIILAESLKTIKYFIDQVDEENTWGKSLVKNQFINLTNAEANFSIYFDLEEVIEAFLPSLKLEWVNSITENKEAISTIKMGAIQLSSIENKFYSNVLVHTPKRVNTRNQVVDKNVLGSVGFSDGLITKPYLVRNFYDGSFEVLVQDNSYTLLLADKNNSIKELKEIGEPIVTDILTLDYYKNGKLQYLFATPNQVYLVDRNGQNLPGYPYQVNDQGGIEKLALIDYNKTKDYRISVADSEGTVYLADKTGKILKGWDPKDIHAPLSSPLRHKRVINKDYMITTAVNGDLHVFKRNGTVVDNFPVTLNTAISGDFVFKPGNTAEESLLYVLTEEGELIAVNLKGAVVKRDQLYRAEKGSRFSFIPDASQKNFVLARIDQKAITFISSQQRELFKKDYISTDNVSFQFYYFGRGKQLFFVHDLASQKSYVYDKNGNMLVDKPISSNGKVSVLYFGRKGVYKIYHTNGDVLEVFELKA